jgi:hypothetical protein
MKLTLHSLRIQLGDFLTNADAVLDSYSSANSTTVAHPQHLIS